MRISARQLGSMDRFTKRTEAQIAKAGAMAVNTVARRARTMTARAIRKEKAFQAGYVNERLRVVKFATEAHPEAVISARWRSTQLIRFGAKQLTKKGKTVPRRTAGVSFRVKKAGSRQKMRGAFFVALRAGKREGENRGIAIQLPGRQLNSKGNPKFEVLYSSSVHNVFSDVRPQIEPEVSNLLNVEFERQVRRRV